MTQKNTKMPKEKSLSRYRLNKYNQIPYIKRFVSGVTKEELVEMFRRHLTDGFLTILLGTKLLQEGMNNVTKGR